MAIMKRRDLEAAMPPEVLRRAREGGMKGKVDWYAGRAHVSTVKVKSDAEVKDLKLNDREIPHQGRAHSRVSNPARALTRAIVAGVHAALAFRPSRLRDPERSRSAIR